MEISAVISSYLMHVRVEKGLSVNTISAYKRDLQKFDEFARKRKLVLESVGRDDLVDFLAGLYRLKLESRTVARQLVTLRNFFRFAQIQDLIPEDPSINLESPKIRRHLPGYLRLEEVEKLLEQPDSGTPMGLRDRAMLEVLYSTGLRVSELIGLRVTDLDSKVGCVRCIGKGDKERIIPLTDELVVILEKYLKTRPDVSSNNLFISRLGEQLCARSVYGLVKKYLKATGIKKNKMAVHSLRHTFGTSLMNNGVNIVVIQELLGHKKLETTRRYLHINSADLRKGVDTLVLNKQL